VDLFSIADISRFDTFCATARPTLSFLQRRLGFDCWAIMRKVDDSCIVLGAEDRAYGLAGGEVFLWSDSLCARMALGLGPRIAPSVATVPAYSRAPFARGNPIGAYAGAPLHGPDGELLGSLAGFHHTELPEAVTREAELLDAMGRLLGASLAAHLQSAEQGRMAERAVAEASTDPLTGVGNRRAWEWMLVAEEERCARFGRPASIVSVDLDGLKDVNDLAGHGAGDELLRRASQAIVAAIRAHDVVARLGGDEFAVLAIECDAPRAQRLAQRIALSLEDAGVEASVGFAAREAAEGLPGAWIEADLAMYEAKRRLRGGRSAGQGR
jgi:diguanylate cyclase